VCSFASAGSSDDTIEAVATCADTARAVTKRPVGKRFAARIPAARNSGTIEAAAPSVRATSVNDPVDFCAK
jgi:hypothetical protein